jgi:hypothetical protein
MANGAERRADMASSFRPLSKTVAVLDRYEIDPPASPS